MEYSVKPRAGHYLVAGPEGEARVGKDKTCSCGCEARPYCPHVLAVADYLRNGGEKALDPAFYAELEAAVSRQRVYASDLQQPNAAAEHRHRSWYLPIACPICGQAVEEDPLLDHEGYGPGWRCSRGGYEHLYRVRYGHLRVVAAGPVEAPEVTPLGAACTLVRIGEAGHAIGRDGRGGFCFTCASAHCEAIRHADPIPVQLPESLATVTQARTQSDCVPTGGKRDNDNRNPNN